MMGILFFVLGLTATGVMLWQAGLFSIIQGASPPAETDYTIIGLSFTAALIFFGLWFAGKVNKEESKAQILFD